MLNVRDIIKATGGSIIIKGNTEFTGVSIDSRTIKRGELFIALKGDRFDGHNFTIDALNSGNGAIVSNLQFMAQGLAIEDRTIILVDNTLLALHNLARYIRKKFKGHVIGVVGSNGKTTTKELISSILNNRLNVLKTSGNLNNHIGMPLSITKTDRNTNIMVLEMGTNRPGDIDELCSIAMPDIGVITNIGYEHLQGFGSLYKVRDAELEIAPFVKKLVVNADDSFLMEGVTTKFKGDVITFAIDAEDADITARDIVFLDEYTKFILCASRECIDINLKIHGRFNIYNSLAATAAAYTVGFNLEEIKKGLESFKGVNMRFEIRRIGGVTFLNDVYNANPSSMEEAINELIRLMNSGKYKRAIVVLGDMLELGDHGVTEHKKLGQRLSVIPIDVFIGVGPLMSFAVSEFMGKGISIDTSEDAGIKLAEIIEEGDIVLIKGSRGMGMEKVMATFDDPKETISLLQDNRG